jgi:hypothetical protein
MKPFDEREPLMTADHSRTPQPAWNTEAARNGEAARSTRTAVLTQATPARRVYRSPLRWAAALTLLVSAAVHVPVIGEHLEEAPYIGYLFIALTVACVVLAAAIVVADTAAVWLVSAVVTALAVLGYVLSRTVGLPQIGDDVGNWLDPLGVTAIAAETVTALLAVLVLAQRTMALDRFSSSAARNPSVVR